MNQMVGDIETQYPLLAFGELGGQRIGVLTAVGLWRWKLFDYAQNQNFDLSRELISQSVQYLSIKEDRRKFRVRTNKRVECFSN